MRLPSVTVFSSLVNIVYSVNSVYRLKTVFGFAFSLSVLLQMVFSARCVCSKYDTWRHGEVVAGDLLVAAVEELRFCDIDSSKNKGRKRKICGACRGRIATEIKCLRLEVSFIIYVTSFLCSFVVVIKVDLLADLLSNGRFFCDHVVSFSTN